MAKRIFLLLTLIYTLSSLAQQKETDSLQRAVDQVQNDSVRVMTLNKLAFKAIFNDAKKAKAFLKQSATTARGKRSCRFGYVEMLNFYGVLMDVTGKSDSALHYFKKSLNLSKKLRYPSIGVRAMNNLGMATWSRGDFQEALHYFLESLKVNESLPPDQQMKFDTSYSNIGLIYQELELNQKALEFHFKAYEIRRVKKMLKEQAISLNNIGICYNSMGQTTRAIGIYKQGLVVAKNAQNDVDYSKILENLGNAYQSQNKYKEAIDCYMEVVSRQESPKSKVILYGSIACAYNHLGQPKKGIQYGELGMAVYRENPELRTFAQHLHEYLAQSYYMVGDMEKGEAYNREFLGITKQIFSEQNAAKTADYEIKYETAKKEKLLAQNKIKLIESDLEARQKTGLLMGVVVLTFFLVLIGLLIFRQQKLKQVQLEQEHQLKTAISQIETQNKLHEQKLNISRDLHDNIGAQLTFIISSVENIKYAFEIDNPRLDGKLENISAFTRATILELRDTIWAMNNESILFDDLRGRVLNFIEKAKDATAIDFNFTIPEGLTNWQLGSIAGMNIYRSIQEAVHNAIKHAHATKVSIVAERVQDDLKIVISDNGIGFDTASTSKGNGFSNMAKRIEEIGGIFTVHSQAQSGTTITFLIPKKQIIS